MKRRYWVVSPNVSNNSAEEPVWKNVIIENNIAFMGWYKDHDLGYKFSHDIQKGDIILIAQGGNQNKRLFIGGIVSTDSIWEIYDNTPREAYNRFLNPCLSKGELELLSLNFTDSAFGAAERIPSIYELHPNRNDVDKKIVDRIELALKIKIEQQNMQNKIELLEYKKQIILQGPPGTGKTRLAKMIAHELIKSETKLSPLEYVDWYIKNFKNTYDLKKDNKARIDLLNKFQEIFSIAEINNMTLDKYCLGKGTNDSFCYWIERELDDLGRFSPGLGGTTVYRVYFSSGTNEYISTIVDKNPNEALKEIIKSLDLLISKEDFSLAKVLFRKSLILKILNSYFPDKYFPIYSHEHLKVIAKILNIDVTKLDDIQINQKINEFFITLKTKYSSEITSFNLMGHLYDKFKIKEDKISDISITVIEEVGEKKIIQFHPAYTYEDFVRGIIVETNKNNQLEYKVVDKTLADFAKKALENQTAKYVLIIDEINRANLASVLGELIYALEYRYDEDNPNETSVESVYGLKVSSNEENKILKLPNNLFIIGTMNTADRSVGHIDYAIKRRFAFVDVLPEIEPVHPLIKNEFIKISNLFIKNFDGSSIPEIIERSESLASDFRPEDIWIGHSYFICKKENSNENEDADKAKPILNMKLKYEIIPLLKEYIKDGILNETEQVKTVMNELISKDFTK